MDSLKRQEKLDSLSEIDIKLETIDSLNDNIVLYKIAIDNYLNSITNNLILKEQIMNEMQLASLK